MTPVPNSEPYAAAAEFVEIALADEWDELDGPLADALRSAPSAPDAAVVDIGAGGGRGVLLAGRVLPHAPIVAVEPSTALRTVLVSRLALDAGLRARTTVLPTNLAAADLPQRWAAALVLNMAGHLEPDQRRALWATAAQRLLPGAPIMVTVQPPYAVTAVPEVPFGEYRVGAHTIDVAGSAEPDGPESVRWDIAYRVRGCGTPPRELRMVHRWHVQDVDGLVAELTAAGLRAAAVGPRLVVAWRGEVR